MQLKGRRVSQHLLDTVKTEVNRLESEGQFQKIGKLRRG